LTKELYESTKKKEKTYGRLDDVICAGVTPGNGSGVLFTVNGNGLAINVKFAVLGLDGTLIATVNRVEFEHVDLFGKDDGKVKCLGKGSSYHVVQADERAKMRASRGV
jgi:hypothetical protein